MPFRYLEEIAIADAAFEATGETPEEMFLAAADATLGVMIEDTSSIPHGKEVTFRMEQENLEMLLFDFLQELIYNKDARGLLLSVSFVEIDFSSASIGLTAKAWCAPLYQLRHLMLRDVKAVTFHMFEVRQDKGGWSATVVLDI